MESGRPLTRQLVWRSGAATIVLLSGAAGALAVARTSGAMTALAVLIPALLGAVSLLLLAVELRIASREAMVAEEQAATLRRTLEQKETLLTLATTLWTQQTRVGVLKALVVAAPWLTNAAAAAAYLRDDLSPARMLRVALSGPNARLVDRAHLLAPGPGAGMSDTFSPDEGRVLTLPLAAEDRTVIALLRLTGVPADADEVVLAALRLLMDQATAALKNAQLHEQELALTATDSVTGLLNYTTFYARLDQEVARAERSGRPLCLVVVNLDSFRAINAGHGHSAGDAVLKAVGEVLRETLRPTDVAGRQAGDEFLIILPDTAIDEALVLAERVCVAIANCRIVYAGLSLRVTARAGVATLREHGPTSEALLQAAVGATQAAREKVERRIARPEDMETRFDADPQVLATQLMDANMATVEALAAAVDAKDAYTRGHSQRVSAYAVALAEEMGLTEADSTRLRLAGLLHDVGKIGVPDAILTKHGPLSDEEFARLAQHPAVGERMLTGVPFLQAVLPAVRHHHERWDGGGYPDGLTGAEIPLDAAIIMVADSFDAMTSSRNYRPALRVAEARERIRQGSGAQFDPRVVEAFDAAFAKGLLRPLSPGGTVVFRDSWPPARASTGPLRRRDRPVATTAT